MIVIRLIGLQVVLSFIYMYFRTLSMATNHNATSIAFPSGRENVLTSNGNLMSSYCHTVKSGI